MSDQTNKLNYYCSVCNVSCTGAPNYQQHMRGKKHQDALKGSLPRNSLPAPQHAAHENTSVQSILASLLAGGAAPANGTSHPERRRERDDPDFSEAPAAKKYKPNNYNEDKKTAADVPGDYYCQICDCHCSSLHTWELHVKGRRHVRNALGLQTPDTAPGTEQNTAPRPVKHAFAQLDAAILDFHKGN